MAYGDILLVGFGGSVYRYANGAWSFHISAPSDAGTPQGLAVDPTTGDILLVDSGTALIYRHDGTSWDTGLAIPSGEDSRLGGG